MKNPNRQETEKDTRPPAVFIPPENTLSTAAKAANDLFLRLFGEKVGKIRIFKRKKPVILLKKIRGASIILNSTRKGRQKYKGAGDAVFQIATAVNRIPIVELPETIEDPYEREDGEPSSKHQGFLTLIKYLLRINRHSFPSRFLLSADPAERPICVEKLITCGWDGQTPLLGILLGKASQDGPHREEIPRRMACLARACDRPAQEGYLQTVVFCNRETGKNSGAMFTGFSRIRPLIVNTADLSIAEHIGMAGLCKALAIYGRGGEIIAAGAGIPALMYSLPELKAFFPQTVVVPQNQDEPRLTSAIQAVLYDNEFRENIIAETNRVRAEVKDEMSRWLLHLVSRYRLTG